MSTYTLKVSEAKQMIQTYLRQNGVKVDEVIFTDDAEITTLDKVIDKIKEQNKQ